MTRAALLVLAGCGRVDFDPRGDGGPGGSGGGGDGNVAITCVPTTEVCNGIDDDCNGLVDEGCPCTPFSVMLSSGGGVAAVAPPLVWTGSGYIAYDAYADLVRTIDAAGNVTGSVPLTLALGDQLLWDGGGLVLARLVAATSVQLSHVASDGSLQPFGAIPTPGIASFTIAHDRGGGYLIVWATNSPGTITGVVVSAAGDPFDAGVTLATNATVGNLEGVARSAGAVGAWSDPTFPSSVIVAAFDDPAIRLDVASQFGVSVAGNANGFVAIVGTTAYQINSAGTPSGNSMPLDVQGASLLGATVAVGGSGYTAVGVGTLASTIVVLRMAIDPNGIPGATTTMFQSATGGSLAYNSGAMWADAERTTSLFVYGLGTGSKLQFVQTCP